MSSSPKYGAVLHLDEDDVDIAFVGDAVRALKRDVDRADRVRAR